MAYFNAPYRPADLTLNSDSINNDLVGFWPLTDGSGSTAVDVSTGGNDGTLNGNVDWDTGELGTEANFTGGEIGLGTGTTGLGLNSTDTATISFWLKRSAAAASVLGVAFGNFDASGNADIGILVTKGEFATYTFLDVEKNGTQLRFSSVPYTNYEYNHFVAVFNGTSCSLYVDGSLHGSVTVPSGNFSTTYGDLEIGGQSLGSRDIKGDIQNVRLFDSALTSTQVEQLYTRPWAGTVYDTEALWLSPPSSPTLSTASEATALMSSCVGWWPLTEGSGTTATDLVGSNDGTQSGGVSWKNSEIGTVASFDGVDDHFTYSNELCRNETAVTCTAWIKIDSFSTINIILYEATNQGTLSSRFNFRVDTGGQLVLFGRDDDLDSSTIFATSAAGKITSGTWYHVVGVFDPTGGGNKVYIDGVDSTSSAVNTGDGFPDTPSSWYGIGIADGILPFAGEMNNLRVFNAALTADQVRLLFERPWIGAEYNESDPLYPPVPSSLTPLDSGASINTGLAAWYPLSQNDDFAGGVIDISGGNYNGTSSGGTKNKNTARGNVADFDGSDDVLNVGTSFWNDNIASGDDFSVNFWFNVDDVSADRGILGAWSTEQNLIIWIDIGGANVSLTSIGSGVGYGYTSVDIPVVEGQRWYMGTLTADDTAGEVKVFLNGVESVSTSYSSSVGTITEPFGIGSERGSSAQRRMDGKIANVRFWSRALSSTEVADIFYSPWLGSAYPSTSTGAPRFLINGLRPLLVNGGLVR